MHRVRGRGCDRDYPASAGDYGDPGCSSRVVAWPFVAGQLFAARNTIGQRRMIEAFPHGGRYDVHSGSDGSRSGGPPLRRSNWHHFVRSAQIVHLRSHSIVPPCWWESVTFAMFVDYWNCDPDHDHGHALAI